MADLTGTWLGTYWQAGNPVRFEMTLVQGNNSLSGAILDNCFLGEATLTGEITGRRINFTKCYQVNAHHCIDYSGVVSENEKFIQGQWFLDKFNSGNWEAYRQDEELDLNLELSKVLKKTMAIA